MKVERAEKVHSTDLEIYQNMIGDKAKAEVQVDMKDGINLIDRNHQHDTAVQIMGNLLISTLFCCKYQFKFTVLGDKRLQGNYSKI